MPDEPAAPTPVLLTSAADRRHTIQHTSPPAPQAMARDLFAQDPRVVARDILLGAWLVRWVDGHRLVVRVVETEAYLGEQDPGSHAFRGRTPRNTVMFGPPGHAYVYFTYGNHWMLNVVTRPAGLAGAVLIRGAEPVEGEDYMVQARMQMRRTAAMPSPSRGRASFIHWLLGGPARLARALHVDGQDNGIDMAADEDGHGIVPEARGPRGFLWMRPPSDGCDLRVVCTTRIGLTAGADLPYRFYVAGSPGVSHPSEDGAR